MSSASTPGVKEGPSAPYAEGCVYEAKLKIAIPGSYLDVKKNKISYLLPPGSKVLLDRHDNLKAPRTSAAAGDDLWIAHYYLVASLESLKYSYIKEDKSVSTVKIPHNLLARSAAGKPLSAEFWQQDSLAYVLEPFTYNQAGAGKFNKKTLKARDQIFIKSSAITEKESKIREPTATGLSEARYYFAPAIKVTEVPTWKSQNWVSVLALEDVKRTK